MLADNLWRVYRVEWVPMWSELALLAVTLGSAEPAGTPAAGQPAEPLVPVLDERAPHFPPVPRERSKKQAWLFEKTRRPDVHLDDTALLPPRPTGASRAKKALAPSQEAEARLAATMPPVGARVLPIATLYNLWTREAWPLLPGRPYKRPFQLFLRDRFTRDATWADTRLATLLAAAALRFNSTRVEVVSGYRSPKYNLMLRKKGHQVARESQHLQGTAVDFRVRGVSTEALHDFVRGLRMGGVGFYPRTRFVHADTGKIRHWSGS
jgi:hypothetical protein